MRGGVGEGRARIFKQVSIFERVIREYAKDTSVLGVCRITNIIFSQRTLDCQECNALYDEFEHFAYEFCNPEANGVN